MSPQHTAPSYTVTCQTHDEAVLHCLHALAYFSENVAESTVSGTSAGVELGGPIAPGGWARDDGRVTFQFSDQRRRGTFLGEATRLLSGKWIRLALGESTDGRR